MTIPKVLYILIIHTSFAYGQSFCEAKTLSESEKKYLKADKKNRANTYEFADLAFHIAECYRQKEDTLCLTWFRRAVASGKSSIMSCDRTTQVHRTIGQIGISEYYLGHVKEAMRHLEKALGQSASPEYNYFLGLCNMKLGNYDIALIEFANFKKASTDLKEVDGLIKDCQDRKNNK